jgi:CHAD domain-containing protein
VSNSRFQLSRSEPNTRGVNRIARRRIAKAIKSLESSNPSDVTVHAARKELKKARAALRLVRDSLSDSTYRRENAALRDAARPLGEVRDGKVLIQTLDDLVGRGGARARKLPLDGLKRALRSDRADARKRVLNGANAVRPQRAALRGSYERAAQWSCDQQEWSVIGAGLKRTYRNGRKSLAAAQSKCSVDNMHEWRKQVKYLWHQLQLLRPLWPGMIGALADQAHKLAEYLGEHHDLAVLQEKVREHKEAISSDTATRALNDLIGRRREELRGKAFVLGHRIYEESPKAFAARFGKYWQDWRAQPVA